MGALLLLRHARHPRALPHHAARWCDAARRRPRILGRGCRSDLWHLLLAGLSVAAPRGLDRRPSHRTAAVCVVRRDRHRDRPLRHGGAQRGDVLVRAAPHRHGDRPAEAMRERHGRRPLRSRRHSPRWWLLHFLHGHQPRRSAGADRRGLCRRGDQLAPRVRTRRRRHAHRARAVHGGMEGAWGRRQGGAQPGHGTGEAQGWHTGPARGARCRHRLRGQPLPLRRLRRHRPHYPVHDRRDRHRGLLLRAPLQAAQPHDPRQGPPARLPLPLLGRGGLLGHL